jgi:hypothetical protein
MAHVITGMEKLVKSTVQIKVMADPEATLHR